MAPPAGTLRVGRYFLALFGILVVLYGLVFLPGQRETPKLGLDLEGGAQVIFKAQTQQGGKTPSKSAMNEAKQIMEQRVNGSGVTEATVVIQGSDQIVVSIPGKKTGDLQDLGQAAQLNFRPVVMPPVSIAATPAPSSPATPTGGATPTGTSAPGTTTPTPKNSNSARPGASPSPAHTGKAARAHPLAAAPTTPAPPATKAAKPTPTPKPTAAATSAPAAKKTGDPLKGLKFTLPTTDTAYAQLTPAQQSQLQAAMANFDCSSKHYTSNQFAKKDVLACDNSEQSKATLVYLLGPVIVPGTEISSASAQPPGSSQGQFQWTVSLTLKGTGQAQWAKYTGAHHSDTGGNIPPVTSCSTTTTPCAEYVAFTLDGAVVSAPHNEAAINGQATQISGSFTQASAQTLARQLKYGALPLSFTTQSIQQVSATLGSAQLKAGMLAGGIGLALVVIYSLIYYRALGFVTIASLVVSGGLTYACLVILGRQIGFTLTLAGIAGFIVAVGITADSFVVFFERLKDEVHGGRTMRVAVPRAWVRARRTIISADIVSFLAAAVLYEFAAGDVKGFAFTLGLSTVLDLVVVFLFTHPMVSLLSRSAAFGSARFTGLNAARVGPAAAEPPARPRETAKRSPRRVAKPAAPAKKAAAVVLLDKEDAAEEETAAEPEQEVHAEAAAGQARQRPGPEPDVARPDQPEDDAPASSAAEHLHAPPKPGSAAERAAARRARLRAEAAERKGKS